MTPEIIEEIRKWAKGGNEPRFANGLLGTGACVWHSGDGVILSPAGLAIAAQAQRVQELEAALLQSRQSNAELLGHLNRQAFKIGKLEAALEQARDTAELCEGYVEGYFREKWDVDEQLKVMRANCERLLKIP